MTEPVRVGELLPGVLAEVVDRAGHGYDRWAELVAQAGYCHHPIRLAGRVEHADRTTGEVRQVYDSEREPDGVLLKACGTRRESRCPSCAATYRADAYQLLAAGLKGGKGVPETVAEHPRLFVTFTAPSFGRVHTRKAQGRLVLPCHPLPARCPLPAWPPGWLLAPPRRGRPSAGRAALSRPATTPRRRCCGTPSRRSCGGGPPSPSSVPSAGWSASRRASCGGWSAISYAKVAEFQRRGAIHFHAVIRLDAATECRCPGCLAPPPEPFTAGLLEDALRQAVPAVRVPCPPLDDGGPGRYARWGEQLDVRNITTDGDQAGELSAEQVAGYIAKYATKATESFGSRPRPPPHRRRRPGPPRQAARPMWPSSSGPAGSWAAAPSWTGCGCGPGRTCSGSAATGRPRAAATPPPSPPCAGPGSPSPSAAGPATACPWTPGAGPRTTRP